MSRRPSDPPPPGLMDALCALVPRLHQWLWRVPRQKRDDVVQETLRAAVESIDRYDPALGSLATWLYKIAIRTARDARARDERNDGMFALDDDAPSTVRGPEERVILKDGMRLIRATLDEMEPELREVFEAVEFDELSMQELAELLGVSERAAKHKLTLARESFRKQCTKGRSRDKLLGLLTLSVGVDALFAAARDGMASSGMRSTATSAFPSAGLPGNMVAASQGVGKKLASFLTGSVASGVIVYLLMRPGPAPRYGPLESAELADRAASIAAGLPRAVEVEAPAQVAPPAGPVQASAPRRPLREARARLEEALRAVRSHELARAHGALARYEGDYPDNPLPVLKQQVAEVLSQAERNRASR